MIALTFIAITTAFASMPVALRLLDAWVFEALRDETTRHEDARDGGNRGA